MGSARYRHVCDGCHDRCRFLGLYFEGEHIFDLYHCKPDHMQLKKGEQSPGLIVARFGDAPDAKLSLPILTLQQHEAEIRAKNQLYLPLLEGLNRYLSTHHEIKDVMVHGWHCQLYRSPLGFVTIRTVDDDIELFVDCASEYEATDAKALQRGSHQAIQMMHERIEAEMLRRRRRWRKR